MTACNECRWHKYWVLSDMCIATEDEVFDCLTGQMVKKSETGLGRLTEKAVSCASRNKGMCEYYTPDMPPENGGGGGGDNVIETSISGVSLGGLFPAKYDSDARHLTLLGGDGTKVEITFSQYFSEEAITQIIANLQVLR